MTFLQTGEADMAEQICRNALIEFPDDANFLCLSGRALIMLCEYELAEERLNSAITLFPAFPRSHVIRGELWMIQGRTREAAEEFRHAIELGDEDPNTKLKLGRALMLHGDREAAKRAIDESLHQDPDRERLVRAFELEHTGNPAEAEKIYREILSRDPENVDALRLLAGTATSHNQHLDAEVLLKRVLELAPDYGKALADLIINQIEQEKLEEALAYAKRLTRIGADNPDSYLSLGNVYSASGDYSSGIDAYEKALAMAPDHPGALSGLAHNLKTLGRRDAAIATYRKCMQSNPLFTETYWNLANLKTFRFSDEEVRAMEELLAHPDIPDSAQIHLCNALGFEYEGRGDFERAFAHFAKCNALKRATEYYDPVATQVLHDEIIEVFDEELARQQGAKQDFGVTPIFVTGLPRSGSTLIEQILASHSLVEGTHELSDLPRVVKQIPQLLQTSRRYPQSLHKLDVGSFAKLGQAYLDRTCKYRTGSRFFIDKNPNNFVHVGLIHLSLPNAIIINARRHPLDSCLGTFKQLFAKGQPFSYDLFEVADFYLQYERMMGHWNAILPGRVLDVRYEDVVRDLEGEVRRMLAHCGLEFEEQCLRFHETDRAVKTASSEQVRQPIYRTSVNLWRHYERHLGPAIEILAPILRQLPEPDRPDSMPVD
jgi:tetratricopeptide (TPR) repeat protein